MKTQDLNYVYPEELIATEPRKDFRTLVCRPDQPPQEITKAELLNLFAPGDVLIINDTKVLKRRIFTDKGVEILFLHSHQSTEIWDVLFPARNLKLGEQIALPGGVKIILRQKGLPQKVEVHGGHLTDEYFSQYGHLALPPYIQKARQKREPLAADEAWYQTAWAETAGSLAAPTASLHFSAQDLAELKDKGVHVAPLTLHVGIGTFLPVKTENLDEHIMHKEWAHIPASSIESIQLAKKNQKRVWALGTTVVRSLESWAHERLQAAPDGAAFGETDLFIRPGFEFRVVDALLTNFHQPCSTLLALVAAFSGLERVQKAYGYAIDKRFRLFSYGDLSLWLK